jgi:acyl-CoA dehydrogenase
MDTAGNKAAPTEIQAIRSPRRVPSSGSSTRPSRCTVRAGWSQDFPLAKAFAMNRTLRFADGPDEVHEHALAGAELSRQRKCREA